MKESDVIDLIATYPMHTQRYELIIPNCFIQADSEADVFCIRKSGLCDEFEVKTSRSDFLADKKKFIRFREMTREEYREFTWDTRFKSPNYKPKSEALIDGDLCINYFWYVVLEGVATIDDMPDYAGLIIICKDRCWPKVVKEPKKLHSKKLSDDQKYQFARKSNYRYWAIRLTSTSADNKPDQIAPSNPPEVS